MGNKINIEDYFKKGKFVVPEYQRGYKWSVKKETEVSSLEYFIQSLKTAFRNNLKEYFIEAVTVVEENGEIILVDGQQRTTSLFLLFTHLKSDKSFLNAKMVYAIREDSHKWLNNLINENQEKIDDEDIQDIFYFKNAIILIKEKLEDIDINAFLEFIKKNVYLLYNVIPKEKAVNTFIALNGLKAVMKEEELIKSDLLIKSSRIEKQVESSDKEEQFGFEWKINEDRGRLARNWDKWLYWWNQKEVKAYFGIKNDQHPLYYLLVSYWKINSRLDQRETKDFSFDNFKSRFVNNQQNAKQHFEGLRKLQKTFEDLYNNFHSHNYLGLIIKTSNNREDALQYFLNLKTANIILEEYAKWSLIGATHLEIIKNSIEKIKISESNNEIDILVKKRKAMEAISLINEKFVYWDENDSEFKDNRKEFTFLFLLLFNLLEDCKLKRKFDFSIWNNRSLEHIFPKSKANELNFENPEFQEGSIHCIGNLVLLYGRDNSSFGAKEFLEKKNTYFNTSSEFNSRNLLHTISVFSKYNWTEKEILENKKSIVQQLNNYYGIKNK